jgi:hypothetical protein
MEPEQCTFNNLNKLNATCGRYSATASFNIDLVELFIKYKEVPLAWLHQVNNQFLIRYGVSLDSSFTWNQTTLDDILSRNPTLTADQFVLPHNTERPYPIFVATHEGPLEGAPFPEKKRAFAGFDFTPLYSGHREIINKSWEKFGGGPPASRLIGGLLETFAFGRDQPPVEGLHEPSGLLEIPMNSDKQLFTLNTAVATSSYFLGGAVTTLGPLPFRRTDKLGIIIPTFPVATLEDDAPPMSTKMVFGDGGTVVQPGLMGMIKRKVAHIIMFLNFEVPLTGSDAWNPLEHPPTGSNNEIDDDMLVVESRPNIPILKIDDIKFTELDLIHLDIEGYEFYALKGGIETIKKFKPVIVLEVCEDGHSEKYGYTRADMETFLDMIEYKFVKQLDANNDNVYIHRSLVPP